MESGVQASATKADAASGPALVDASSQSSPRAPPPSEDAAAWAAAAAFSRLSDLPAPALQAIAGLLRRAGPLVVAAQGGGGDPLAEPLAALAAALAGGGEGGEGGAAGAVCALRAPVEQPSADGGGAPSLLHLPAVGLSWSATGRLAAAFGRRDHGGWCRHAGGVAVWGARAAGGGGAAAAAAAAPEALLETPTCATAVAFHPAAPHLLAAGTHGGEVWAWDVSSPAARADGGRGAVRARSAVADYARDPIVGLAWAFDARAGRWALLSACAGGRLHHWCVENGFAHPLASAVVAAPAEGGGGGGAGRAWGATAFAGGGGGGGGGGAVFVGAAAGSVGRLTGVGVGASAWLCSGSGSGSGSGGGGAAAASTAAAGPPHARFETTMPWAADAVDAAAAARCGAEERSRVARCVERAARGAGSPVATLAHFFAANCAPLPPAALFPLPRAPSAIAAHAGGRCAALALSPFHRNLLASAGSEGGAAVLCALLRSPLLSLEPPPGGAGGGRGGGGGGGGGGAGAPERAAPAAGPLRPLTAVAWAAARPLLLAAGAASGEVHLWDLFASTAAAPAATLTPDGRLLLAEEGAVGSAGGGDGDGGGGGGSGGGGAPPTGAVCALAFHPTRRRTLAAAHACGAVQLWRLPDALAAPAQGEQQALDAFMALSMAEAAEEGGEGAAAAAAGRAEADEAAAAPPPAANSLDALRGAA
jgi:hypothetical protein